jgi:hypothetical protein
MGDLGNLDAELPLRTNPLTSNALGVYWGRENKKCGKKKDSGHFI